MSKQGSRFSKKQKRDDASDSEDSDDDLQPIHFFVPGENINAAVLVEYITQYVDRTAKITSSHHPTDKTRTGFNVSAKKTLNAVSLRDIINDSKDWDVETQSKSFRRNPYRYSESDTARRRARQGASKGGAIRPATRQHREASAAAPDAHRRERPAGAPSPSNVPAQYTQYQSSQPYGVSRSTSGYSQPSSRLEYASNTYNIYNTVASTSYNANVPANSGGYAPSPYSSVAYPQVPDPKPEYPPPSYEQSGTRVPPRPMPPDQPDPDAFDSDGKARTGLPMDMSSTRPGPPSPGQEPGRSYTSQSHRPSTYDETTRRPSHKG